MISTNCAPTGSMSNGSFETTMWPKFLVDARRSRTVERTMELTPSLSKAGLSPMRAATGAVGVVSEPRGAGGEAEGVGEGEGRGVARLLGASVQLLLQRGGVAEDAGQAVAGAALVGGQAAVERSEAAADAGEDARHVAFRQRGQGQHGRNKSFEQHGVVRGRRAYVGKNRERVGECTVR
ncbi:hypothetical protein EsDP_00002885 [Epichloe bromicola]|uniref:Uncharacterized protein n=1 Tax=Epichloe bromicola TaxID=79588 RepID=A0ABQ0CM52_9HYPO